MIGKKDTHCIFEQYRSVLKEQAQESKLSTLLSKVKASTLDSATKNELLEILEEPKVQEVCKMIYAQKAHGNGDADAAGYSSYPSEGPAEQEEEESSWGDVLTGADRRNNTGRFAPKGKA